MRRREFLKCVTALGASLKGTQQLVNAEDRSLLPASGKFAAGLGMPTRASCKLLPYNGKPTVFVNGKPCFPMAFISYFPKQFRYKRMRESGIQFFTLSITLGDRWYNAYKNGKVRLDKKGIWDAPDKIDFEVFDKSINEILEVAPDAYIFPRIYCDSPSWWDNFHPAETNRTYDTNLPMRQSFSSLLWRQETAEVLRKIVRHAYQSSYADRFIGIHVCAGETEEGVHHSWLGYGDYSLVAQKRFRQWLSRRYNNDQHLIERLFNKKIDQIGIPSPQERDTPGLGDFLDPEKSRLAIDYRFFRCEEMVESLDALGRAVKEESGGNLLTGTFYGHTFTQWLDHMGFSLMLKSPNIDFVSSTTLGTETGSITKAGKIFYNEGDERTCLSKWISELRPEIDPYHEYDNPGWLRRESFEQSMEHLKSEFVRTICTNSTIWWFDLWGGWYDHDRILNLFSEMQKVADRSIQLPREPASEVCVFVDEKSFPYLSILAREAISALPWVGSQLGQIGKLGAPHDLYLLDDLKDMDLSRYKMIVFFNAFVLHQKDRELISRKCMTGNRNLLWLYAPGLIDDKLVVENVSAFLKMDIASEAKRAESPIELTVSGKKLNYTGAKVAPFVYVKDGATSTCGQTRDGRVVLAEKKESNCTNILACVPPLPWQAIQHYAKQAGVHIYSDAGDMVTATESYLAIMSTQQGKRTIRLPRKARLVEVLDSAKDFKTDRTRALEVDKDFEIEFPPKRSVKVFELQQQRA